MVIIVGEASSLCPSHAEDFSADLLIPRRWYSEVAVPPITSVSSCDLCSNQIKNSDKKKIMKIGIITLPPYANFGGILQAYALSHVLQGMGHETEVVYIEKRWQLPLWKKPLSYTKRAIKKYILRRPAWIFYEKKAKREWLTITQNTFRFVEKHIRHRFYKRFSSIHEGDYDAFVVGSDQVWRPKYFTYSSEGADVKEAYLHFAKKWNVKRIAYAASFGVDNWEYTPEQTTKCARLVKAFDAVSVREESAVELCRHYLNVDAKHLVDPTLLLDRKDYEALIGNAATPHKGKILNYILDWDDEKGRFTRELEKATGKQAFRVNSRIDEWYAPLEERIQPSVESWLQGFRDADLVITDSFHACVFSIIFNKPFFVVGNQERGLARIHSLLAMFGLEDRLVSADSSVNPSAPINWETVNSHRQELETEAMKFLKSTLYTICHH